MATQTTRREVGGVQRTISLVISMPRRSFRFKPQDWPVLLASERLDHVCGVEDSARSPLSWLLVTIPGSARRNGSVPAHAVGVG